MEKTTTDRKRRNFLFAIGAAAPAAGVAGWAAVTPDASQTVTQATPSNEPQGGYRLTDHVRKYYASVAYF